MMTVFAPIMLPAPTVTGPRSTAPAPTKTASSMTGIPSGRSFEPDNHLPTVTPWKRTTSLQIFALLPIITPMP